MVYVLYGQALKAALAGGDFSLATVVCAFGVGNMPQSNNIAVSMEEAFAFDPFYTGLLLAFTLALVIIGGIQRIAQVASTFVPIMSLIYVLGAFSVIFMHLDQLLPSLQAIVFDAFTGSAATGGFLGASFAYAFNRGVNRGLFLMKQAWAQHQLRMHLPKPVSHLMKAWCHCSSLLLILW